MGDAEGGSKPEPGEHVPISQTGLLPVSPSLEPALEAARVPQVQAILGPRAIWISGLAVGVAFAAGVIARLLVALIAFVTNLAFYQRISLETVAPAGHRLGLWVVAWKHYPRKRGESLRIPGRQGNSSRDHSVQTIQLHSPDSCLQVRHSVIESHFVIGFNDHLLRTVPHHI